MAKSKTKPNTSASQTDASSPSFPKLADGPHDLASLAATLGEPDDAFRRLIFRNHKEQTFYEWGVQAETGNILSDMPRFVTSSLRILGGLDPARRELVLVPPEIFAVVVGESLALAAMNRDHGVVASDEDGDKTEREATLKRVSSEGVGLRNRVIAGLRSAVGEERAETVRKAANDASSSDALMTGLKAVARFIDDTLKNGTDDDKAALEGFKVAAARGAELRAKAAEILEASTVTAGTGKRVSKRALDIQDGRVLVLVEMIHRAFRLARRSDKSILMPELNRLASLFDTGASAPVAKEEDPTKGGGGTP